MSDLFHRAEALMPWGTQTNGKRPDPSLGEAAPGFVERAEGCRFMDEKGRWFIDYRSALGPIILGYNHPLVQEAVHRQLEKGVVFSLASPLELALAEQLTALIPGLEQVRYLKSGNEANLACIRLARAHTGRNLIVTCGYHGHGDWFSCGEGAPMAWPREGNGTPTLLDSLVIRVRYGDLETLEQVFSERGTEIAGLMMVPYDWGEHVATEFVLSARALTEHFGSVLIFDQILTGFRLDLRGAQGYFGVIPDLTTYGKAIANGFPLAVFGGRRAVMRQLDRVHITTTHAGEALSIAAACATLRVMQEEPVLAQIWVQGERLKAGFDALARKFGIRARCVGLPPALRFRFGDTPDEELSRRRQFYRGLIDRGIFPSEFFLLNYAHIEAVIDKTLAAMAQVLPAL